MSRILIGALALSLHSVAPVGADTPDPELGPVVAASPSVVAGNGRATVTWSAATSDSGGSSLVSYTATASPGGQSCTTETLSCTITGLTNWTTYTVAVRATDDLGSGPASPPSAPFTPQGPPGRTQSLSVTNDGRASWSTADTGAPIDAQVVRFREIDVDAAPGLLSSSASSFNPLVIGGSTIDVDDYRYTAKLFTSDTGFAGECGAVLISPEWALTAAHCTEYERFSNTYVTPSEMILVLGGDDPSVDGSVAFIDSVRRHPDYNRETFENDIALLQLDGAYDTQGFAPIPLVDTIPLNEIAGPDDDQNAFITGWGAEVTGGRTVTRLKGAAVEIDASCGIWPSVDDAWDDDLHLCATSSPDAGFCSGDSGGPLVIEENGVLVVAGLVSFNSILGCGEPTVPDVYTRVSTYVDWIEATTGPLWTQVAVSANATSVQLPELQPGRSYAVQVHAENGAGAGARAVAGFTTTPTVVILGPEVTGVDCTRSQPHPLTDVPTSSFAYDAVGCIYNLGITTGTSPTTYSPADTVTREQMAAFLARFYTKVTGKSCAGSHPFVDVSSTSFASESIGCIFNLGVTTGTSTTTYSPADTVTREQMAAFLARLHRIVTETACSSAPSVSDVAAGSFAYLDVGCLFELGVTTGTTATTYSPADEVTREQMAAFLARLYIAQTT